MILSRHLLKLLISVLKTSKNYRLAATIGADPKTKVVKFHLRYQWNHADDQEFQVNVLKGDFQPIGPKKPTWMPTSRGIALNLDDLKEFLEADICGLLLNTIIKKEVKKWVQEVVLYICNQNEQLIPQILEMYQLGSKKDYEQTLKVLLSDFLTEYTDVDTMKLVQEIHVIVSLLQLHRDVGLGPM